MKEQLTALVKTLKAQTKNEKVQLDVDFENDRMLLNGEPYNNSDFGLAKKFITYALESRHGITNIKHIALLDESVTVYYVNKNGDKVKKVL